MAQGADKGQAPPAPCATSLSHRSPPRKIHAQLLGGRGFGRGMGFGKGGGAVAGGEVGGVPAGSGQADLLCPAGCDPVGLPCPVPPYAGRTAVSRPAALWWVCCVRSAGRRSVGCVPPAALRSVCRVPPAARRSVCRVLPAALRWVSCVPPAALWWVCCVRSAVVRSVCCVSPSASPHRARPRPPRLG
jgi:hypothetical protein